MPLIITGIIDGPLSGGVPKAIEFTATEAIADLSVYGVESANNGAASTGPEYTFPAISLAEGETVYLSYEVPGFTEFFGFAPDDTAGVASINGDDAIVLWQGDSPVDVFGAVGTDGTGEVWDYADGWAYRTGAAPSTTFDPSQWAFSGTDALDGATSNADASAPFPAGSYSGGGGGDPVAPALVISELDSDQPSTDAAEFVEIFDGGAGGTSLDGVTLVLFNGNDDLAYASIPLDGYVTNADGYFVVGSEQVANVGVPAWTTNGLQNGPDAAALYFGDAPAVGDAATDANLIDALVYGTADPDDAELLAALGETVQWDESANANPTGESLQRQEDGSSVAAAPTPGAGPAQPPAEVTLISTIQGDVGTFDGAVVGTDDVSPLAGQLVTVEAIVTADFQDGLFGNGGDLNGFFLQEEDYDQDGVTTTSEGLFVFDGTNPDIDVALGDRVRVTGTISEFFGQTQITALAVEVLASGQDLPTAIEVTLDGDVMVGGSGGYVANLEAYEGMRVTLAQQVTVTELFNLDRFGEYGVATERFEQFTQSNLPDAEAYDAYLKTVAGSSLTFDDGASVQNPDLFEIVDGNDGVLTASDSFRMGDTITDATGVLNYAFNEFRIQNPTGTYAQENPRPESPEPLAGNFTAASVNVLNYFTTLDDGSRTDIGLEPRGANTAEELERQATKLVDAIVEMDADVLGLLEIENDFAGTGFAVADLVDRLNAVSGEGTWAYVDPGQEFVGGDAIANALIYQTAEVRPVGELAILTEFEGRDFLDPLGAGRDLNRAAIAQTFEDIGTGQEVTISVNHLKSKGSLSGLSADEDQGDGAGNNNATRAAAADILADWLASDPTGQGAENVLILGDLNSYAREEPIRVLEGEGYVNLAAADDPDAYSYVFDGLTGTLDYALANGALADAFVGATEWHINADEADALDYNLDFDRDPSLYTPDATRYSDHDPILVAFELEPELLLISGTEARDRLVGTRADERILGLGGDDLLIGKGGDDVLVGGAGNDVLVGGLGDDTLVFDGGRDKGFGGAGDDRFIFSATAAMDGDRNFVRILDFELGADRLDLDGTAIARVNQFENVTVVILEGDGDRIILNGVDDLATALDPDGSALLV